MQATLYQARIAYRLYLNVFNIFPPNTILLAIYLCYSNDLLTIMFDDLMKR